MATTFSKHGLSKQQVLCTFALVWDTPLLVNSTLPRVHIRVSGIDLCLHSKNPEDSDVVNISIKSNQIKIFISPAAIEALYISVTGSAFYT